MMDKTNDFSALIQAKSIQRVLAPIAAQVSQLLILNESEDGHHKMGNMIPFAQSVLRASEELVQISKKSAANLQDEDLQEDMWKACSEMTAAGRGILMAIQLLQAEKGSKTSKMKLADAGKRLLLATLKLLQISDESEVQKIHLAVQKVQARLEIILIVKSMKNLVSSFKGFTESTLFLAGLCEKRRKDLTDLSRQQQLASALGSLNKLIPAFNSVIQNHVKYPQSVHAKVSCDLIYKHVTLALTNISQAVQTSRGTGKSCDKSPEDEVPENVQFAAEVARVVHLLSPKHRSFMPEDLSTLVSVIVKHSMYVAALSNDDLKEEITQKCKMILQQKSSVLEQQQVLKSNRDFSQLAKDFNQNCEDLAKDVLGLENCVKDAIVYQVVDAMLLTNEPMEQMVKAAIVRLADKPRVKDEDCMKMLQPLDDALHDHMDRLCQVALIVASSCTDDDKSEKLVHVVKALEDLDPEVFPACLAVRRDCRNKAAIAHLKLIFLEWRYEVATMVELIDDIIDTDRFMEVSELSIESDMETIRHTTSYDDYEFLAQTVSNLLGKSKRVLKKASEVQDLHEDPIFRNGLQVYISQLENALPLVKNGAQYVILDVTDKKAYEQLYERCNHLMECVKNVHLGMDARNHPHLFSPLRDNPRDSTTRKAADFPDYRVDISSKVLERDSYLSPERYSYVTHASPRQTHSLSDVSRLNITVDNSRTALPKPSLELFYPVREAMKAMFVLDYDEVERLLEVSKVKSENLIKLTERAENHIGDNIKRSSANSNSLRNLTESLRKITHKGLEGEDSCKAEALIIAEQWCNTFNNLRLSLRDTLEPWVQLVLPVLEAGTSKLSLAHECDHLSLIKESVVKVVSHFEEEDFKSNISVRSDVETDESILISRLHKMTSDWTKLTNDLRQKATELSIDPDNAALLDHVEFASFDWSIHLCDLLRRIVDFLKRKMLPQSHFLPDLIEGRAAQDLHKHLESVVMTARVYLQLLEKAFSGNAKEVSSTQYHHLEDCLRTLLYQLTDKLAFSSHVPPSDSHFENEAESKMQILECLSVVNRTCDCIDKQVEDIGLLTDRLIGAAQASSTSTGSSRQHFMNEYHTFADTLSLVVSQTRQFCVSLLMTVPTNEKKTLILQCIDELSKITPKIMSVAGDLADKKPVSLADLHHLKREWCCNAHAIQTCLRNLPGIEEKQSEEIKRLLKGMMTHSHLSQGRGKSLPLHSASVGAFVPVPSSPSPIDQAVLHLHSSQSAFQGTPGFHSSPLSHRSVMNHGANSPPSFRISGPRSHSTGQAPGLYADSSTGRAPGLYADSSFIFQGEEPRLVTSLPKEHVPEEDSISSKPFRSRPLGLQDFPYSEGSNLKSASLSSIHSRSSQHSYGGNIRCSSSIAAAALILQQEADKWEEDNNDIIQVAMEMSEQMYAMAGFAKRKESKMGKAALVDTAKDIAANASEIFKFAESIAKYSKDERFAKDLMLHANQIPSLATQLNIIASVKAATPEDFTSDVVLVKNAENLMNAVVLTLKAAETACVKGLRSMDASDNNEQAAAALASQWKRKLQRHRMIEAATPEVDALGLRRTSKHISAPSLTEIVGKR